MVKAILESGIGSSAMAQIVGLENRLLNTTTLERLQEFGADSSSITICAEEQCSTAISPIQTKPQDPAQLVKTQR
jgi:hypothetical protein